MILLLDSENQVGSTIMNMQGEQYAVFPVTRESGDLNDNGFLKHLFEEHKPEIFICTYEYSDISGAEYFRGDAYHHNSFIIEKLAVLCAEYNVLFVYFSSSHVFDGTKKGLYHEDDQPCPVNVYGDSKNLGEQLIRKAGCRFLCLRTGDVYGNMLSLFSQKYVKIIRESWVQVVQNQVISPIYVKDLVEAMQQLLQMKCEGIYNIAQSGTVTSFEFLQTAVELYKQHSDHVNAITIEEVRPENFTVSYEVPLMNALTADKYQGTTEKQMRNWKEALQEFVDTSDPKKIF